jgi:hypothetical protein
LEEDAVPEEEFGAAVKYVVLTHPLEERNSIRGCQTRKAEN